VQVVGQQPGAEPFEGFGGVVGWLLACEDCEASAEGLGKGAVEGGGDRVIKGRRGGGARKKELRFPQRGCRQVGTMRRIACAICRTSCKLSDTQESSDTRVEVRTGTPHPLLIFSTVTLCVPSVLSRLCVPLTLHIVSGQRY
jgi:hypothetical protein